jgi:hypothetical protein
VRGPDQLTPSLLVQTWTTKASRPPPVCEDPAVTIAPEAFTASDELQPAGGWTGVDHWLARAGAATAIQVPAVIMIAKDREHSLRVS